MIFVNPYNIHHLDIIEEGIFKKIHNKLFGADKIKIPGNTFCGKSGLTLYVDIPHGNHNQEDLRVLEILMTRPAERTWFEKQFKETLRKSKIDFKDVDIEYLHIKLNKSAKLINLSIAFIDKKTGESLASKMETDISWYYNNFQLPPSLARGMNQPPP